MAVPQSMSVEMTGRYHARRATLLAPRCSAHSAAYEIASAASSVGCESCGASKGAVHRVAAGLWKSVICQNQYKASAPESGDFPARGLRVVLLACWRVSLCLHGDILHFCR